MLFFEEDFLLIIAVGGSIYIITLSPGRIKNCRFSMILSLQEIYVSMWLKS